MTAICATENYRLPKDGMPHQDYARTMLELQPELSSESAADRETAACGTPANEIVHSIEWNDGKSQ